MEVGGEVGILDVQVALIKKKGPRAAGAAIIRGRWKKLVAEPVARSKVAKEHL